MRHCEADDDRETQALFQKCEKQLTEIRARQEETKKNAKSNVTLDIKPTGADVNMETLLKDVRQIKIEGLTWLSSEFIHVAYGIQKIRIMCQILDEATSPDAIIEALQEHSDIQSVDVFAFQMA
jgi:elongation factor 1-beta